MLNSVQSRFRPCLSLCAPPNHTQLAVSHRSPARLLRSDALKNLILGCAVSSLEGWELSLGALCMAWASSHPNSHCLQTIAGFSNQPIMSKFSKVHSFGMQIQTLQQAKKNNPSFCTSLITLIAFQQILRSFVSGLTVEALISAYVQYITFFFSWLERRFYFQEPNFFVMREIEGFQQFQWATRRILFRSNLNLSR